MSVEEAYRALRSSGHSTILVGDSGGVVGVFSGQGLEKNIQDGAGAKRLDQVLDGRSFPHVHNDHPLSWALERMGAEKLDLLPVVSRSDVHKLEGLVDPGGPHGDLRLQRQGAGRGTVRINS